MRLVAWAKRRLYAGVFMLLMAVVILTLGAGTVVQRRQAGAIESAARIQEDSLMSMAFYLEREAWRFSASMQGKQSGEVHTDQERALRFDILLSRIGLLRQNPSVARLYKTDEYRNLMPRLERWVQRATPLADQGLWHDPAWQSLMTEWQALALDVQALTAAADAVTGRQAEEQVHAVHQQSRWIAWLTATQVVALLLGAVGLWLHLRRVREANLAQKRLNEALAQAKVQAEAVSRGKSQFLANMSHELRTPFNGILGMLGLLDKTKLTAQQQDLVQTARSSAERLLRMLQDLLEVSALEAGQLKMRPEAVDLPGVIRQAHAEIEAAAAQKGLKLVMTGDVNAPVWVSVDAPRLLHILRNLLDNALKYTERGGIEIHVRAIDAGDQTDWLIDVQDTGIGMSWETQQSLFERFHMADPGLTRKQSGPGLGLGISRSLAHLMGGDLTVSSTLGRGSTFSLTLRTPVVNARQVTALTSPMAEPPTMALRVLVAEDHPVNRKVLGLMLKNMGHLVTFAEDGLQALEQARGLDFDLILMDIHMPVMDGLSSARAIRALGGHCAQVPIVALTADVMNTAVEQALEAGMNAFLSKPLQREQLEALLPRPRICMA